MTELRRRPHWDDELIDAVFHAIKAIQSPHGDTMFVAPSDAYTVIAAVEDWQAEKRRGEAAFSWLMARDARQQAAIARVRELHAPIRVDLAGSERCGYCAILPWPCDTIRAIDGGAE